MTAKKEPTTETKLARMQKETGMYEQQKELFEKSAHEAEILRSDVQDLHKILNQTNPLAAALFRTQVVELAAQLETALTVLQKLE